MDVSGTGRFTGALTLDSTLSVASTSTFTGKTTHNGGIGATSGSFSTTLAVTGATTLKSNLAVTGATTLTGYLTANSGATITGDVRINGNLVVTGDTASGGESGGAAVGSTVSFSQTQTSGTQIGAITIDGVTTNLYVGKTLGSASTYGVTDSTAAAALSTGTNLVTERDVYYGLASINGARQNSSVSVYAPTSAGTQGYTLIANSSGIPTWIGSPKSYTNEITDTHIANGVNILQISSAVTLTMSSYVPIDRTKPCAIILSKMSSVNVTIPPKSSGGVILYRAGSIVNTSAAYTLSTYLGAVMHWSSTLNSWVGYVI